MGKTTFTAPTRASASHLIHLIGVDCFRKELAKMQKANVDGIMEVITATTIRRTAPATRKEQRIMNRALSEHLSGNLNDLLWAQIRTLYVYRGALKNENDCLTAESLQYPEGWEPSQDLSFAKRLLPNFLHYQLVCHSDFETCVEKIIMRTRTPAPDAPRRQNTNREEQIHWEQIKNSHNPEKFRAYLKHFKGGAYERLASVRLEELIWQSVCSRPSYSALAAFLESFPYGLRADEAKSLLALMDPDTGQPKSLRLNYYLLKGFVKRISQKTYKSVRHWLVHDLTSLNAEQILKPVYALGRNCADSYRAPLLAAFVLAFATTAYMALSPPSALNGSHLQTKLVRTFKGHSKSLQAAAFLPNSSFVLSASEDKTLKLWDVRNGKEIRTFYGHTDIVQSVSVSPDGQLALSGSHDNTLILWDLQSGILLKTFYGHTSPVVSVRFSHDGKLALSGSHDKTVKLWDISRSRAIRTFHGHEDWVVSVDFVEGTKGVLSGSHDATLRLWDIKSGKNIRTFKGHKDWVTSVTASRSNDTAISSSFDNTIRVWNMKTGKEVLSFDNSDTSIVNSLTLTPDERMVLSNSIGVDRSIILWDVKSGRKLKTLSTKDTTRANAVSISPDGFYAVSAGEDNVLMLWRLRNS